MIHGRKPPKKTKTPTLSTHSLPDISRTSETIPVNLAPEIKNLVQEFTKTISTDWRLVQLLAPTILSRPSVPVPDMVFAKLFLASNHCRPLLVMTRLTPSFTDLRPSMSSTKCGSISLSTVASIGPSTWVIHASCQSMEILRLCNCLIH